MTSRHSPQPPPNRRRQVPAITALGAAIGAFLHWCVMMVRKVGILALVTLAVFAGAGGGWEVTRRRRAFLESRGHRLVVTSDKDRDGSVFDSELPDADVVIFQPFRPAYLTADRIAAAQNLKHRDHRPDRLRHADLDAAVAHGVTVAEVTYCNSISVAEHVVMTTLSLVRNYPPSHRWVLDGS